MADAGTKPILNVADVSVWERGHGDKLSVKFGPMAPLIGLAGRGCALRVVPPGKRPLPLHRHHVISGDGEYRWGDENFPRAGDVIGAPAGMKAHQIVNTGADDLRYLGVSTMGSVDICEYPESGKIAAAAGIKNADFAAATYRGLGRIQPANHWDGEA